MLSSRLFRRSAKHDIAQALYKAIVAQARQPALYLGGLVADTPEGRFEMVVLHVVLVMRHLGGRGREAGELTQLLFNAMFADMDDNLREIGVGDLSVGRKIRKMVEAFYGRLRAYDRALNKPDPERAQALTRIVSRNVPSDDILVDSPRKLTDYVLAADHMLRDTSDDMVFAARVNFPKLRDALRAD
ncbi:MAG: ubiquinol-cytochrome C chaperone family protein [Hyphomicrobiales bacterium]